jgi:hypothetical protein
MVTIVLDGTVGYGIRGLSMVASVCLRLLLQLLVSLFLLDWISFFKPTPKQVSHPVDKDL